MRGRDVLRGLLRCGVLSLATISCGLNPGSTVAPRVEPARPVPEARDVETRLFLIGDAGVPLVNDPVLASLTKEVVSDPQRSLVVFLGDNVYPRGLPPERSAGRKEAERRLDAQIDVADADGARAIFIPGNHDWDRMGRDGLKAVLRQAEYIRQKAGEKVTLQPQDGCPGPVVQDVNTHLRLVLLDTQWWLQQGEKPGARSSCPAGTEGQVLDLLRQAIAGAEGRRVVVAGHHPVASGGTHGGYFSWRDHVFPLRARKSWLWIPLPGIGSIYPVSRQRGWSDQDLAGPRNRKLREALGGVFEKTPPLVYAAGHEHNLQVIESEKPKYLIVSGAGAFGHVTDTVWTKSTLYATAASGYMRLDVETSGRIRLAVIRVDAAGKAEEAIAFELTAEPETQHPPTAPPPGTVEKPETLPEEQKPGKPETENEPTRPPDAGKPSGATPPATGEKP